MEFIEANKNSIASKTISNKSNKPITKSHPQAYYTSRLLDFTKKLDEILSQEEEQLLHQSECLDSVIADLKSLGVY